MFASQVAVSRSRTGSILTEEEGRSTVGDEDFGNSRQTLDRKSPVQHQRPRRRPMYFALVFLTVAAVGIGSFIGGKAFAEERLRLGAFSAGVKANYENESDSTISTTEAETNGTETPSEELVESTSSSNEVTAPPPEFIEVTQIFYIDWDQGSTLSSVEVETTSTTEMSSLTTDASTETPTTLEVTSTEVSTEETSSSLETTTTTLAETTSNLPSTTSIDDSSTVEITTNETITEEITSTQVSASETSTEITTTEDTTEKEHSQELYHSAQITIKKMMQLIQHFINETGVAIET